MSQEKAQLIAPLGVMAAEGINASGVITATSFVGDVTGAASSLTQGSNVSVGIITASSFTGNLTGNVQRITGTPTISVGVATATSFDGNLTGSVTDLTSAPAITVGVVTATTLKGPVTGNITGDISGHAGGLGVSYNGGWPGAGTSQISAGVVTATSFYGDGSNLDGVSGGPVSQQAVTIDGASTTIDLSNGNLIYATQSADTTVSFANSENGNVYFVRVKDATVTARTITWPSSIVWNGGSAPTLIGSNSTDEAQIFQLVTRDDGVTWYGKEIYNNAGGETLWAWGNDGMGSFGNNVGGPSRFSSPVQIPGNAWSYYGVEETQVVVKNDGTLWSWGHNDEGKLGQNNAVNYSSPTQIGTDNTWLINTGYHRGTVTVKSDGTMWTWGSGSYGALGHNNQTQYSSPKQVGTDTTWATGKNKFTSNGQTHAIKTDGTLWSWGRNNEGQLGQGNTTQYSSPKQVGTDTTWSHVQCCFRTTIATKTNGTLWSWGYNNQGEQGVNDRTQRNSPQQVGTDTTWDLSQTAIVSDNSIGCIKTDGTLWAWGYGGSGALGQNNIITRSSPCQIPGTSWRSAVIQQSTSAGTKTDGTLWTWGNNTNGQIGNNTQQPGDGHYSSPVQIPGTSWVNVNYNSQVMTASKSA